MKRQNQSDEETPEMRQQMIASMDFARWDHPTVMKAFQVLRQLNNWLGTRYAPEYKPHGHLGVAAFGVVLLANDILLWDSEENDIEELTLDFCKGRLKEHAQDLMVPFEE